MSYFPEGQLDNEVVVRLKALFGFAPRVLRLQANLPNVVEKESLVLEAFLASEDWLSRSQKELILLAVSRARASAYGTVLHEKMLSLVGSESVAARLLEGAVLEDPEGALVRFVRKLTLAPTEMTLADAQALRDSGFSDGQIVEIVALVGFAQFFTTVQFGTSAAPDFAPRSAFNASPEEIPHRFESEHRPIVEEVERFEEVEVDPDAEWVQKVQGGEVDAFQVLVERHSLRVYRTLVGLLGNADEARDAVQDTFLKAFRSLNDFKQRARFSTWLTSIASNTGLQRLRERKNHESIDEDVSEAGEFRPRQVRAWGDDPEQNYSKLERKALVERAIRGLPSKYRLVLILRDVEQVSTKDAAAVLGLSLPALKARLFRARLMLREALAPHFAKEAQAE